MTNPFSLGMDFGSNENCIKRIQILLPPLVTMMEANERINEHFVMPIYEDLCLFYNDEDQIDFSQIKDENLRMRAERLLPDLNRLLRYLD